MTQRTVNVCDVHAKGGDLVPATVHSRLELDSVKRELDLCAEHAAQLRAALSGFLPMRGRPPRGVKATKATRRGPAKKATAPRGRRTRKVARKGVSGASGARPGFTEAVRKWAREQGIAVKDRGRLPRTVIDQYTASH